MRTVLKVVLISTLFTVLILGFEHFSPIPRVGDRAKGCCGELTYSNRHGFPLLLREDISGGIAYSLPKAHYYINNYAKFGSIIFISTTFTQLAILLYKKRSAPY